MTRRRRIVRSMLALACMLIVVALGALWWRSSTTIDTLAWTTQRLDPVVAAKDLPPTWGSGPQPFSGAFRTFSISAESNVIRLSRDVYLQRPPTPLGGLFGQPEPTDNSASPPTSYPPYPFPPEPSL